MSFLRMHPNISAQLEVHFFDKLYKRGLDWYRRKFKAHAHSAVRIDHSPNYFHVKECAERIANDLPGVKLILVVRDPVKRLISDYHHQLSAPAGGKNLSYSFVQKAFSNATEGIVSDWFAIETGKYSVHLQRFLQHFQLDKDLIIIDGERLTKDPAAEVMRLQTWLGLSEGITEDNFKFNAKKGFYCPAINGSMKCLQSNKGHKHQSSEEMSEFQEKKLREFYRPFNEEFYAIVNHDFGW